MNELRNCPDCGIVPGKHHRVNCDVERCSVCGGQRFLDDCVGHDKEFAKWRGIWPGKAEADYLGIDLNTFEEKRLYKIFFIKENYEKRKNKTI